ncbi:proteasome maturation ans ribosome synthesis protein Nop10 [Tirmania nivea]|nr:proteasome maturation ans ribosome synthesis protein Nop10 [Tirmania nivea]
MAQIAHPSFSAAPKTIRALVLDAAPFLSHSTPPTSLLCRADRVYTTPAVLSEIRDSEARARLETQWLPFITTRNPRAESVRRVTELAKKTGDKEVLSGTDLGILGLAFELECELRGCDTWMRKDESVGKKEVVTGVVPLEDANPAGNTGVDFANDEDEQEGKITDIKSAVKGTKRVEMNEADEPLPSTAVEENIEDEERTEALDSEDNDYGEWITPSNIHKFRIEEASAALASEDQDTPGFAACATSDFAMQNVLLLLPIPLISPTFPYKRIRIIKQWLLRCHACFYITRVMKHQFCPRCGGPTLLRTSCATDTETGKTTIYLKKNFQWNNRGNVFSVPKPTGGRASGKEGNGVRHELILRADQKEYVRQREEIERRSRKGERDLMDGDYLPGILTGERNWHGGRVKIGHGKQNPNGKRKGGGGKTK